MPPTDRPLRIALLVYRGNPRSGGQGVYVRHLATALRRLGHDVEVLSGPPYPELEDGVRLTELPSLDLYGEERLFRPKRPIRDGIDLLELGMLCTSSFPEPLTFSLRAHRWLREHRDRFDIVHDNQCLGYGFLGMVRDGLPVIATIHHPITIDKEVGVAHERNPIRKLLLRRWYGFVTMQQRVARRLPRLITVSRASHDDIVRTMGVDPTRMAIVPNGVDPEVFKPMPAVERVPGRILTTASADVPLKGLPTLIEAVAKVRTERAAELVVVGRPGPPDGPTRRAVERFGMEDGVRFAGGITTHELVHLFAQAQVAVVPSLYEGFSLPAVEAMACGVPLVATTGGALPEVAGKDGETAMLVPPRDPGALAGAIGRVLDDADLRRRLSVAARERVLQRFTWATCAEGTVQEYRALLDRC